MAASKAELSRAGTMDVTAKEGQTFLDKNLTEWKKPYLMNKTDEQEEGASEGASKPKLSKHTTMKGTAKDAESYLADKGKPDADAQTRGQQKKIEDISSEKPAAKKAKMARDSTMAATAKEAKGLLAGEKLSDTRQETKAKGRKSKADLKRLTTMDKAIVEAKAVYKDLDLSGGRSLRKRPEPPKPAMKRAGTMQKTAKEGKAYLKRGGKKAKKAVEEEPEEEEEEKEDKEDETKDDKDE